MPSPDSETPRQRRAVQVRPSSLTGEQFDTDKDSRISLEERQPLAGPHRGAPRRGGHPVRNGGKDRGSPGGAAPRTPQKLWRTNVRLSGLLGVE